MFTPFYLESGLLPLFNGNTIIKLQIIEQKLFYRINNCKYLYPTHEIYLLKEQCACVYSKTGPITRFEIGLQVLKDNFYLRKNTSFHYFYLYLSNALIALLFQFEIFIK